MADLKISQLTGATTPLAGTEVVPLVQSSTTKKVAVSDLTAGRAVSMASVNVSSSAANSAVAGIYNNDTADGNGVYVKAGGANSGKYNIVLQNAASQDLLAVYADGTVQTGIGNIKINTAAKGVNFTANTPAAGMTSQLLNWYEEGTWTPAFTFATPGNSSFTYSTQTGWYTRVGNTVTIQFGVVVSSATVGSGSGNLLLSGLPFISKTGLAQSGVMSYADGYVTNMPTAVEIASATSSLVFVSQPANAAGTVLTNTNVPAGGTSAYGAITYLI